MTLPHPSPLAVLLLCSTDDPDRAAAALLAARAAAVFGATPRPAVLLLESEGVRLGAKGVAEAISGGGRPDAKDALASFVRAGGRVLVARAAWAERGYQDDALVEGASLCGPSALAELAASHYAIASF
ncbi:MAG: DsrE family protein [Planctomycetes bacterium]|nr:DsrE family protein [Planctomycetota bacterium]